MFCYKPTTSLTASGTLTTEKYEYAYDHAGRLTELKHGVNATPTTLATYSYDELGRQQQKGLKNGNTAVETITYAYNIQQRLTDIQSTRFKQQLLYHTGTTPQYGGNISVAQWTQHGTDPQAYTYTYDGFSRLLEGKHSGASPINTESQTYDANGNMLTIARTGTQAQSLSLTYSGNQLATAKIGSTIYTYTYDANGNMKTDGIRGMTMVYNRINLPQTVSKGSYELTYGYAASGQKREKKYNNTTTQHYRGSIVYNSSGAPEYVLTPEGMVRNGSGGWVRQYNLTDHLGNTRAVLDPNAGVSQQTDYYPFGAAFSVVNTNKNKYLYGGKELQDEVFGTGTNQVQLNLYDFETRFMDTKIPRFTSLDLHAESYFGWSPYVYCANNPINLVDPTGMDWYSYDEEYKDENGETRTRTRYTYYSGTMSKKEMANSGYTNLKHVGETVSIANGDGTYINFYQNAGILSSKEFNAKSFILDNGLVGDFISKKSNLANYAKAELLGASERRGQRDFIEHPLTQAVVETMLFVATGGIEGGVALGGLVGKGAAKGVLRPLGLGSTGRTAAANLTEQLAMKEIMSDPTLGKIVMTGMKDSRWFGWSKIQYTHTELDGTKTTIHYVGKFKNGVLKAVDDFKFK